MNFRTEVNQVLFSVMCYNLQLLRSSDEDLSARGGSKLPFQIDQHTGVLSTCRQLDLETDGSYFRFDVTAGAFSADDARYVASDRASVIVRVIDVNDNRPTILFPVCEDAGSRDCGLEFVAESRSPDDVITRVIAVDPDDANGQVRYELLGGEAALRLLRINATSGEVKTRQDIHVDDNELIQVLLLEVLVFSTSSPCWCLLFYVGVSIFANERTLSIVFRVTMQKCKQYKH